MVMMVDPFARGKCRIMRSRGVAPAQGWRGVRYEVATKKTQELYNERTSEEVTKSSRLWRRSQGAIAALITRSRFGVRSRLHWQAADDGEGAGSKLHVVVTSTPLRMMDKSGDFTAEHTFRNQAHLQCKHSRTTSSSVHLPPVASILPASNLSSLPPPFTIHSRFTAPY